MSKVLKVFKNKVFLSVLITLGVIITLIFASSPAQAVSISITSPGTIYIGYSSSFSISINVNDPDVLPLQSATLEIYNDNGTDSYSLPLDASTSATYTGSVGGTAVISSAPDSNWGYGSNDRYGYGYGYGSGWGNHNFGYGYGYGYGYGDNSGPSSISYSVAWTSPSSWQPGTYHVRILVQGNSTTTFTNSDDITFTLSYYPAGGSGGPPPTTTPASKPGSTDVSDVVTNEGVFTETVTAISQDNHVSVTIPINTKGYTIDNNGNQVPISEITIEPSNAPTGANTINVLGQIYDLGPSGAHFEPPITLTFTYDPSKLLPGETPVITYWDTATGKWVEIKGGVIDPITGTITVQLSHFTVFAVQMVATPPATTPAVTTPAVTTPAVTTPAVTTPAVTPAVTTPAVTPATTTPTQTTTPVESTTNWGLIIGIIVAAVIVIGLIIFFVMRRRTA
jgi:hypothetical protein